MSVIENIAAAASFPYGLGCIFIEKVFYGTVTPGGYNSWMIPLALAISIGLFIIGSIMWSVKAPFFGFIFKTASIVPFISSFVIGVVPAAALGASFIVLIISSVIGVLVGIVSAF